MWRFCVINHHTFLTLYKGGCWIYCVNHHWSFGGFWICWFALERGWLNFSVLYLSVKLLKCKHDYDPLHTHLKHPVRFSCMSVLLYFHRFIKVPLSSSWACVVNCSKVCVWSSMHKCSFSEKVSHCDLDRNKAAVPTPYCVPLFFCYLRLHASPSV